MSSMHSGFGEFELDLDPISLSEDEEASATVPTPGSARLEVEDKCEALFITAEWTLIANVVGSHGTLEIARSTTAKKAHTGPFIKRWARQMIRTNKARLVRLGVDVPAAYLQWGGLLEDLDD